MDYNLWYSRPLMAYWFGTKSPVRRVPAGRRMDAHSQFADPEFMGAARGDYRPGPDSPARRLRRIADCGAETLWR